MVWVGFSCVEELLVSLWFSYFFLSFFVWLYFVSCSGRVSFFVPCFVAWLVLCSFRCSLEAGCVTL